MLFKTKKWYENLKLDSLNSDTFFIKIYKNVRKIFLENKKIIMYLLFLGIMSYGLTFIDCEIFSIKFVVIFLSLITAVSIFIPVSFQKNITKTEYDKNNDKINNDIKKGDTYGGI